MCERPPGTRRAATVHTSAIRGVRLLLAVGVLVGWGCHPQPSSAQPTAGKERARLQALLDRAVFTLSRDGEWLKVVTTPCYTKPAMTLTTDFYLQRDQTFTSEPDHHVNTEFRLVEIETKQAVFDYTHRTHHPTGAASEDRGRITLGYRQRPLHFPDAGAARTAATEALRQAGIDLTDLDPEHSAVHLDRTTCSRWSVRILRRAPSETQTLATAGGAWIVRLDMATGESTVTADD